MSVIDVVKRIREGAKERPVQMKMFVLGALRYARAGYRPTRVVELKCGGGSQKLPSTQDQWLVRLKPTNFALSFSG